MNVSLTNPELALSGTFLAGTVPQTGGHIYAFDASGDYVASSAVDAGGNYSFDLAPGLYKLYLAPVSPGYSFGWFGGSDFEGATALVVDSDTTQNIALSPLYVLSGTFFAGTVPQAGGVVYVFAFDSTTDTYVGSATVDATGHYSFAGLPPGSYKLFIAPVSEGYGEQWFGGTDWASATPVVVNSDTTQNIALSPLYVLSGTFFAGTVPQAGGVVYVFAFDSTTDTYVGSATVDATGHYSFAGLPPGSYKLFIAPVSEGYGEQWFGGTDWASATPVVVNSDTTQNIALSPLYVLSGTFFAGTVPQTGGTVYLFDSADAYRGSSAVNAAGHYSFAGLPAGSYEFYISPVSSGYGMSWFGGADFASATSIAVNSDTTQNIALPALYTISGIFTADGLPQTGGAAYLFDEDGNYIGSSNVDGEGNYAFDYVLAGSYKFYVVPTSDGFEASWFGGSDFDYATPIDVEADTSQDISLATGISGTFTADGYPQASGYVDVYDASSSELVATTQADYDGHYSIELTAGSYKLLLEPIEYGFDETWYGGATWDDATTIDVTGATYVDIALSDTASIDSGSLARAEIAPPSAGAVAPIAATLDSYSATASSAPATLGGAPRTPTLGRWGTWSVIETSAVGIRPAHALSAYDPVADTIAPSVPGNLAGDVKSGSEIDLSWSASTDNVAVAGYRLYRDGDLIATVGSTSWFDTALVAGSTHTYTVSAIDAAGNESALSASLTKTTPRLAPIDATAPSSPTGVAASATSSPYGVSVSWTASTDNIGVTRYSVSRNGAVIGVVSGAATGFFDATTVASSAYTYTVTASDAAGNVSAASSGAALTTPATSPPTDTSAPSIPADLVATAVNTSEIDLSWTASSDDVGVAGYRIYRDGTLVATTVSTSYADTPVGPATSHTYTLAAFDGAGNLSAQGTSASAATPASDTMAPTTPTGVAAVSTAWNTVTVSWTASTDAVGVSAYTVRRNGAVVGSVSGAATSYIDATTAASTAYTYTLTASDAAGNTSAASSAAPVTSAAYEPLPDTSGPSLPAGLSAAAAPKGIDLAWSASTDNVAVAGYRITRDGTLIATTVSTAYADTDLVPGVPHTYTVTAFDAAGNTSAASTASASAYPLPLTALTYTYDLADRLTAITTASGATTSFGIDALGRHASRTVGTSPTETYGYLGTTDAVVSIAAGGTTTTSAIDATGSRVATASGGSFGYTLPDLHGNVAAALDAAGTTISDAFLYDAYGDVVAQVTSGLPTPWRYQGRILESAAGTPDLYDFAARSYAPALGMFTSLDTSLGSALNPHLLNGYLYADANPATLVDPDGHDAWWGDAPGYSSAMTSGWCIPGYCPGDSPPIKTGCAVTDDCGAKGTKLLSTAQVLKNDAPLIAKAKEYVLLTTRESELQSKLAAEQTRANADAQIANGEGFVDALNWGTMAYFGVGFLVTGGEDDEELQEAVDKEAAAEQAATAAMEDLPAVAEDLTATSSELGTVQNELASEPDAPEAPVGGLGRPVSDSWLKSKGIDPEELKREQGYGSNADIYMDNDGWLWPVSKAGQVSDYPLGRINK